MLQKIWHKIFKQENAYLHIIYYMEVIFRVSNIVKILLKPCQ